ncbi:MAG: hypothetical protein KC425_10905, partial [Anaerolineales bacterium]|nr:hypothetical protein [Anaerolineales bacterium]
DAATAGGARLPVAYGRAAGGPGYAFRSAPPGVVSGPDVLPPPDYNPLYACAAAVFSLFGDDERLAGRSGVLETAVGGTAQGDERVFGALAALFRATPEGERYVQLYLAHGPEMGRIGLADPALLWDGYGTLQNFMPGLAALVSGNGRGVTVTQQMADDALDVWTRIAAQASPALAAVIQQELAASSNLQDFVGLTFDEWALAIGVPPPRRVFLPVVKTAD